MTISVIVVTYNQQSTIARTLDSILAQQTEAEVEIVIGDDCSSDGTEAICRDYAARFPDRITYLRRDKNLGVVRNYFDCIDHARGNLLADCAGDDFWVDPHKLQAQLEVIKNDPDVSLVATDWLCCDEQGLNPHRHPDNPAPDGIETYAPGQLCAPLLSQKKMIHLCTALYRKDMLMAQVNAHRDIFINPAYTCEDQQIILAMAHAGKIVILPRVTLHYTVGHDSISHRTDYNRKFDYSLGATRQTIIMQRHFGVPASAMQGFYTRQSAHICAMAFRSGSKERMTRYRRFRKENNLPLSPKSRLYMFLAANPLLWKMARAALSHKNNF